MKQSKEIDGLTECGLIVEKAEQTAGRSDTGELYKITKMFLRKVYQILLAREQQL